MSDTSYPVFQHYGTNAQRLAFTPSPGALGQPIYIWYETDTGSAFLYDTSWHQLTSGGGTLPSSAQGDVFYASASNVVSALNKNTSATRYLSNTGGSNNPAWAQVNLANGTTGVLPGASGGGLVLLEQHTASTSAALNFTTAISATYDEYQIEVVNIVPATGSTFLLMRMSTDGGATYDSGANYNVDQFGWRAGASATNATSAGQTAIAVGGLVTATGIVNTNTYGVTGTVRLYSPSSTTLYKQVNGQTQYVDASGPVWLGLQLQGAYINATAVNAFQFLMSSGNIASGTIRVYGLAK